jgi:small membrane protein
LIGAQIILVAGIVFLLLRYLASPASIRTRAWKKILGVLLAVLAVIVVVFPDFSNDVAHSVGIGRGADLLLYLLTLAFGFGALSVYVKDKKEEQQIVLLARKVALLEATTRYHRLPDRGDASPDVSSREP